MQNSTPTVFHQLSKNSKMALTPYIFNNYFKHLDEHFDSPFFSRLEKRSLLPWTPFEEFFNNFFRSWPSLLRSLERRDAGSNITIDKDKFEITLDVKQFAPEEITVKTLGSNQVVIEAKHEEKEDDHGKVSRHFVRKYILPSYHDASGIISTLSDDGILTITAPKEKVDEIERIIPIAIVESPKKAIISSIN